MEILRVRNPLQCVSDSMEAPAVKDAPALKEEPTRFAVPKLAEWAEHESPTHSVETIQRPSTNEEAIAEEAAILEQMPVWKLLSLEEIFANLA